MNRNGIPSAPACWLGHQPLGFQSIVNWSSGANIRMMQRVAIATDCPMGSCGPLAAGPARVAPIFALARCSEMSDRSLSDSIAVRSIAGENGTRNRARASRHWPIQLRGWRHFTLRSLPRGRRSRDQASLAEDNSRRHPGYAPLGTERIMTAIEQNPLVAEPLG